MSERKVYVLGYILSIILFLSYIFVSFFFSTFSPDCRHPELRKESRQTLVAFVSTNTNSISQFPELATVL